MNELMRTASDLVVALATTMLVIHSAALLKATKRLVFASETIASAESVETDILVNAVNPGLVLRRGSGANDLLLSSTVAVSILSVRAEEDSRKEVAIASTSADLSELLEPNGAPFAFTTTSRASSMQVTWAPALGGKQRKVTLKVTG